MKKLIFTVIVALMGVVSANAQNDEMRKEVEILLEQSVSMDALTDMLYNNLSATLNSNMSDDNLRAMCVELAQTLYPDMVDAGVAAYSELFTVDEVKEINKFYQTPVGKKLAANLTRINQICIEQMMSPEAQAKMMPIILKYMQ